MRMLLEYEANNVECILDIKTDTDIISITDYSYSGFRGPLPDRMHTGKTGIPNIAKDAKAACSPW